ncbi:MAG TPA: hypothetical protein VHP58_05615 [Alphaproteobacteria bacterium]|nr:hypothetical protein [Alphaproteobacteria bacterium]
MNLQAVFPPLMIITFIAAILTLVLGISGMMGGHSGGKDRSTQLMALRVGLCAVLLFEIIIYITFVRP